MRRILMRPRRFGTPVVLSIAVATFAALAATSQGFPVKHVSLNDGGIWVTDNQVGAIGRFDKPSAQLDGGPVRRSGCQRLCRVSALRAWAWAP